MCETGLENGPFLVFGSIILEQFVYTYMCQHLAFYLKKVKIVVSLPVDFFLDPKFDFKFFSLHNKFVNSHFFKIGCTKDF